MPSAPRYKKRQKISLLPIFKFSYIINEGKQAFPASTIPNQLKQTVTIILLFSTLKIFLNFVNETRQKSCVGLNKLKLDQGTPEANNIIVWGVHHCYPACNQNISNCQARLSEFLSKIIQSNLYITVLYKYSGHPVYYSHWKTFQNFQLPYIFCKVHLYNYSSHLASPHDEWTPKDVCGEANSHPVFITVTLPFPKGDCCMQLWLYL